MADFGMRWILQYDDVCCVVPSARKEYQVLENAQVSELPPLNTKRMEVLKKICLEQIGPLVDQRW
jgi:aryl-alcohol dehydrogenase-like predicted oxidoreductase